MASSREQALIACRGYHGSMSQTESETGARVHASAHVDPEARLGDDVVIGPGCLIDGPVVIGEGTHLLANVHLQAPLTLGAGNTVYPFSCIGFAPQDRKFTPESELTGVSIGDQNVLREGVTINGATGGQQTSLGNFNYLMAHAHIGHDCVVGHHITFANGAALGGHVTVGDQVNLGGNAGVQQFCRVGRLSMIAGNEGITRDLPPFCMVHHTRRVSALNLVGMRRAGHQADLEPMKRAFDLLYRRGLKLTTAIQRIDEQLGDNPLCAELMRFLRQSERGITPYARSKALYDQGQSEEA